MLTCQFHSARANILPKKLQCKDPGSGTGLFFAFRRHSLCSNLASTLQPQGNLPEHSSERSYFDSPFSRYVTFKICHVQISSFSNCPFSLFTFFYNTMRLLRTSSQITIGAPKRVVIAFMGKVYSLPGNWAIVSLISMINAPTTAATGRTIR